MKGSKDKLLRFPCTSCGLCCKNITGIIELVGFDAGNGCASFWIQKPICARFMNPAR
ncbi:hypothetical protein VN0283_09800 [Helicobacter pylori]|nr:hypothetical protein VN0283_09800 [Helicobacter pylori]